MTKTVKDVKNYWNNRPCNIKHSKKKLVLKNTLMM